jgi:hypothetical protein
MTRRAQEPPHEDRVARDAMRALPAPSLADLALLRALCVPPLPSRPSWPERH